MQEKSWLEKERQKREIKKFIRSNLLPNTVASPEQLNQNDYHIKWLEHLGFKNIKLEQNFITAKFPKGWRKISTYLSDNFVFLIDEKNRKRASIFFNYFYSSELDENETEENKDKLLKPFISSHITWLPRYMVSVRRTENFPLGKNLTDENLEKYYNSPMYAVIIDNASNEIIFETQKKDIGIFYKDKSYPELEKRLKESLFLEANEYLLQKFPESNNIKSYW